MTIRATFNVFQNALKVGVPPHGLAQYVEFDESSPVPRLQFATDALLDDPPAGYDVDRDFLQQSRKVRQDHYALKAAASSAVLGIKRVVAEGDSWFSMPMLVRPNTIADAITWDRRFLVTNIAYWGHTLSEILRQREYMQTLRHLTPDFFILSAGGNDLQQGLAATPSFVHRYDPARPEDAYLTPRGQAGLAKVGEQYDQIFDEVTRDFPGVGILCHGYDYPRPLVGGGAYVGKHMRSLGIPESRMQAIIDPIIRSFNSVIAAAAGKYPSVQFLNLLGTTEDYRWLDDMHPGREGFRALARIFMRAMS